MSLSARRTITAGLTLFTFIIYLFIVCCMCFQFSVTGWMNVQSTVECTFLDTVIFM